MLILFGMRRLHYEPHDDSFPRLASPASQAGIAIALHFHTFRLVLNNVQAERVKSVDI